MCYSSTQFSAVAMRCLDNKKRKDDIKKRKEEEKKI